MNREIKARPAFLFLLLITGAVLASPAHAGLITDGGFESAVPSCASAYSPGPIGDGWSVGSGQIAIMTSSCYPNNALPHSGVQFADLDYAGALNQLTQTLATTPGQLYTLTFWFEDEVGGDAFSVSFGGSTVTSFTTPSTGVGTYQFESFANLAATGSSTVLAFSGQFEFVGGGVGTVIDDVSVVAQSAVPEPGALATVAFGLITLGLAAVRRHADRR